jgi:UDP-2,3-diacylglucosamine pyrophosphatase LpxH
MCPAITTSLLRDYQGIHFGGIEVLERDVFETADGKRLLVIHGDEFDMVVMNHRWLAHLGDIAYGLAMWTNKWHNRSRKFLGLRYWSFSRWAKLKVKSAVNFISDFEEVLADEARKHDADGVICGHIHHAANEMRGGIRYINTGDWVESCTADCRACMTAAWRLIDWSRRIPEKAGQPAKIRQLKPSVDAHGEAA